MTHIKLVSDGIKYTAIPNKEYDFLVQMYNLLFRLTDECYRKDDSLSQDFRDLIVRRLVFPMVARKARVYAGISQTELAALIDRSPSTINNAEAGRMTIGINYVAEVIKACGVDKDISIMDLLKIGDIDSSIEEGANSESCDSLTPKRSKEIRFVPKDRNRSVNTGRQMHQAR